jgi:hypothetical protein
MQIRPLFSIIAPPYILFSLQHSDAFSPAATVVFTRSRTTSSTMEPHRVVQGRGYEPKGEEESSSLLLRRNFLATTILGTVSGVLSSTPASATGKLS